MSSDRECPEALRSTKCVPSESSLSPGLKPRRSSLRGFLSILKTIAHIPFMGKLLAHRMVSLATPRLKCRKPIDVAVVHAERRRDQHRVVNLFVGRAVLPGARNIFARDLLAALLHLAGNGEQRL